MISLVMLAIMAGCAVYLYLKGTLALGIGMVFNMLIAGLAAFGFFEIVAQYVIKYSPGVTVWAHTLSFALLLVLVFALLQSVVMQINKEKINLGLMAERIGRPIAGVVLGYLVTGYVLVAAAMAPLPSQYPYRRFAERNPNPASPQKALLSPDGFVTGLFGMVSRGGFRPIGEPKSFAMLHADYLDQLHLNRRKVKEAPLQTSSAAVDVPRKQGVWNAPDSLRDTEGKSLSGPAGTSLMVVRVEFRRSGFKEAPKFTLAQLRLVCGIKGGNGDRLAGKGEAVYPVGYIGSGGRFEHKSLDEVIDISKVEGDPITMDVGFHVPTNLAPVLLEFKRNNVVQVPAPTAADEAPPVTPFGAPAQAQAAPDAGSPAEPGQPSTGTAPRGSKKQKQRKGLSDISRGVVGDVGEEN